MVALHNSHFSQMPPSNGLVAAIDFGTACTCYAVRSITNTNMAAHTPDGSANTSTTVKPSSDLTFVYHKKLHPTAKARVSDVSRCYFSSAYPRTANRSEFSESVTFRAYKMALYPQGGKFPAKDAEEFTVVGSDGQRYPLLVILRTMFAKIKQAMERNNHYRNLISVTITVPAIATDTAKEIMMSAATRGLEIPRTRVVMITEPDAALRNTLFNSGIDRTVQLQEGQSIIIFDIGGGTSDFVLARVASAKDPITIEYPLQPEGKAEGGWDVDKHFLVFMKQVIHGDFPHVRSQDHVSAALLDMFINQKHSLGTDYMFNLPAQRLFDDCTDYPATEESMQEFLLNLYKSIQTKVAKQTRGPLPRGLGDRVPAEGWVYLRSDETGEAMDEAEVRNCTDLSEVTLVLSDPFVRSSFYVPVIEKIAASAESFVRQALAVAPDCRRVQFVGGFTCCRLLTNAIQAVLRKVTGESGPLGGFSLIRTDNPSVSVAYGATIATPSGVVPGRSVPIGEITGCDGAFLRSSVRSTQPPPGGRGGAEGNTNASNSDKYRQFAQRVLPTDDSYSSDESAVSPRPPGPAVGKVGSPEWSYLSDESDVPTKPAKSAKPAEQDEPSRPGTPSDSDGYSNYTDVSTSSFSARRRLRLTQEKTGEVRPVEPPSFSSSSQLGESRDDESLTEDGIADIRDTVVKSQKSEKHPAKSSGQDDDDSHQDEGQSSGRLARIVPPPEQGNFRSDAPSPSKVHRVRPALNDHGDYSGSEPGSAPDPGRGPQEGFPFLVSRIRTVVEQTCLYAFEYPRSYDSLYNNPATRKRLSEVFSFYSNSGQRIAYNTVCLIFERGERIESDKTSKVFTGLRPFDDAQRQIEIVVHSYPLTMKEEPLVANPKPYTRFLITVTDEDMAIPFADRTYDITFTATDGLMLLYSGPAARRKPGGRKEFVQAERNSINLMTQRQLKLREMQAAQGLRTAKMMLSPNPQHTYMVIDYSGSMGFDSGTKLTYPQTRPNFALGGDPTVFATVMEWVADYLTIRRDVSQNLALERFTMLFFTTTGWHMTDLSIEVKYDSAKLPSAEEFLAKRFSVQSDRCFEENFADTLLYLAEKAEERISNPNVKKTVFFLSDGESALEKTAQVSEAIQDCKFASFAVIGFGEHREETLRAIAELAKGEYVCAKDAAGLREVYGFGV